MAKRLIVCCDGTWQDATADSREPPSNVTRLSRALSRTAIVTENGQQREVPQIVYYQKGVGTGLGDRIFGGVTGVGISANVRAAYGFLAENYSPGDKIFFFGFSRGAYTARAVAGIVCQWGLLTARGMDNFSSVYEDFYARKIEGYTDEQRRNMGFRDPLPRFTVEIIGVWDTVAFHKPWLGKWVGEQLEFRNTLLSREVKYAFHALGLDEERTAYQPTLWHEPDNADGQELIQVWFSGAHTDIGGGGSEPRLSNIALGWMIAQCSKHGQLSFDVEGYLFDRPPGEIRAETPWATALGATEHAGFLRTVQGLVTGRSVRTPLAYEQGSGTRPTYETIHVSIRDRILSGSSSGVAGAVKWVSPVIKGGEGRAWTLKSGKRLDEAKVLELELFVKGRVRTVRVDEEN